MFACTNQKNDSSLSIIKDSLNCRTILTKYDDGAVESTGIICNSLKEGSWSEYYPDGDIRWKGNYLNNVRQYDTKILNIKDCKLYLDKEVVYLEKNKQYNVRVDTKGSIHPDDIYYVATHCDISTSLDKNYDIQITPTKNSDIIMQLYFKKNNMNFMICGKRFSVLK
jgi:hypothetical protein